MQLTLNAVLGTLICLLLWRVIALGHRLWSVEDDVFDLLERVEALENPVKEVQQGPYEPQPKNSKRTMWGG